MSWTLDVGFSSDLDIQRSSHPELDGTKEGTKNHTPRSKLAARCVYLTTGHKYAYLVMGNIFRLYISSAKGGPRECTCCITDHSIVLYRRDFFHFWDGKSRKTKNESSYEA